MLARKVFNLAQELEKRGKEGNSPDGWTEVYLSPQPIFSHYVTCVDLDFVLI